MLLITLNLWKLFKYNNINPTEALTRLKKDNPYIIAESLTALFLDYAEDMANEQL